MDGSGEGNDSKLAQARAAFDAEDYDACIALCTPLVTADPGLAQAWRLMGVSTYRKGDRRQGAWLLSRAVEQAPDDLSVRIDYGTALTGGGQRDQAIEVYLEGLRQEPFHPDLVARLVPLLSDAGRSGEALPLLLGAIPKARYNPELRVLLATEYAADLRSEDALMQLAIAEELAPKSSAVQTNLGVLFQGLGVADEAIRRYERAISLAPNTVQAHLNLGTSLLSRLELERGFREVEWRLKAKTIRLPKTTKPHWEGEPLAGRRLLVSAEQGIGDMIQYIRFLPRLTALEPAEIVVECQQELVRLFSTQPAVSRTVSANTRIEDIDTYVSMISLPARLGCTPEQIWQPLPYIPPPAGRPLLLPPRPEGGGPFRVGLVWTTRPSNSELYIRRALNRRHCPLEEMAQLAAVPGVAFYSLQLGAGRDELHASGLPFTDMAGHLGDFQDTAALLSELDLLITIDTSAAHLAGAMGRPVWILLAHGQADYRWGVGEESSPWYPQARLFRANRAGWPALLRSVAAELEVVARGGGRITPPRLWGGPDSRRRNVIDPLVEGLQG